MNLRSIWNQFITLLPVLLLAYIPTLVLLGVLLVVNLIADIPYGTFTDDLASMAGTPSYYGLLSNIGVLLWCSAVAICLFSLAILRRHPSTREWWLYFLFLGLITLLLLIDDFFLLHEAVGDWSAKTFGIKDDYGEAAVLIVYGLLALWLFIRFRAVILSTEFVLLGLAVVFFLLSAIVDIGIELIGFKGLRLGLVEDILKFFGIVSWLTYVTRTALKQVGQRVGADD